MPACRCPSAAAESVLAGRRGLERILDGSDPRVFVVVGPCSIHDPVAGIDYARRLKALADEVADTLLLVMRVYFEKPRTSTGWKGYINDPRMDDSFHIEEGLHKAREFLLAVNELGLPAGTEALDPIAPQYLGDLIAWTAIGARTSESQTHREMSSGLSTPVGFKNGTDGDARRRGECHHLGIQPAQLPRHQHAGPLLRGAHRRQPLRPPGAARRRRPAQLRHGQRRAGRIGAEAKAKAGQQHGGRLLARQQLQEARMQPLVMQDCINQIREAQVRPRSIVGLMIESFIEAGNQPIPADLSQLKYGCSVTDACVDWATTETMIRDAAAALRAHSQPA
jgi:3-deoxy-7-phosphoheptulonate synthase